jgi:hypothetical protein
MISLSANHLEATASLFRAEAPRIGEPGFGAEEDFRIEARRLFRMALNALRRRGASRNSLNATRNIKQSPGNVRPQVEHNFA